jgi:OmpA-OmpF porin, OOP family
MARGRSVDQTCIRVSTLRRMDAGAVAALLAAGLTMGCASAPIAEVEAARAAYESAAADEKIGANAPVALYEAEKTVKKAEAAAAQGRTEDARHEAYLAEKRVEIAKARAEGKVARDEVDQLRAERDRVQLSARTTEADRARERAEGARKEAEEARARARQLEKTLSDLEAKKTDRGVVLTLGDVLFEFGTATLGPGSKLRLDKLVAFLREHPDQQILIEGHTDSVGSESFNVTLSQQRADAVLDYLVRQGIAPSRILSRGLGEGYPIASNESSSGRQQNRRVEIVILEPGERAADRARQPVVSSGP